jgi:lipoyl(octanoyl) transferase
MKKVYFEDWGTIEYGEAWDRQEVLLKQGVDIKSKWYSTPEAERQGNIGTVNHLFFCEHPHVYTLGKSGHITNLLVDEQRLKEMNVAFYKTNRGGDITYHGPGQVVGYPVLDLEHFFTDLGKYMRSLEEVIILTLAQYGIEAGRLEGATGVWLDADVPGKERKICAMGVKCSRWMTMHGFALNVNTDMSFFNSIVPCGLNDKKVTSIQQELGRKVDIEDVKNKLKEAFGKVFIVELLQLD